jgi:hypothetical protein
VLVEQEPNMPRGGRPDAHIAAFFESIRTGKPSPAGLKIGVTAALTSIMGREAIYQKRVTTWQEMGVDI